MFILRILIITLILTLVTKIGFTQSISKTETPQSIPLKSYQHMYYIEVHINNKRANLLVDTGAAFSILDITQAEKYGFKFMVNSGGELIGLGGKKKRYSLKNCKVDHKTLPLLLKAYGADMEDLVESFSVNGLEIVGIIGSDYFTMSNAVIDYKNRELLLNWRF